LSHKGFWLSLMALRAACKAVIPRFEYDRCENDRARRTVAVKPGIGLTA
jgi:hypothetical protein